jgi:hypothetical protein
MTFESKIQYKIWQIIREINESWVSGNPDDLKKYFHEEMVIASPDFQEQGRGREVCVESYKSFSSQAIIRDFKEKYPKIFVFGATAIASYIFQMSYEMNGKNFEDAGRDMFIFIREGDKWQAIWRTILPVTTNK